VLWKEVSRVHEEVNLMGLLDWFRRRRKKPPLERVFDQREKLETGEKPKKPEEPPSEEIIEGAKHREKRRKQSKRTRKSKKAE